MNQAPNLLKLINEWRDTLGIFILSAAIAYGACPIHTAFLFWGLRECGRAILWWSQPPRQIAGGPRNPTWQSVLMASFALFSVCFVLADLIMIFFVKKQIYSTGYWMEVINMQVICILVCMKGAGGLLQMAKTYQRVWDWPRRDGSGGMTATDKLKDFISAPTPVPATNKLRRRL